MSDFSGKLGLILGVANKRSISWAVAQAASAAGARLALTYPSERLEENVRELAAKLDNPIVLPCDVTSDQQIGDLASSIQREFGGLDFVHAGDDVRFGLLGGRFVGEAALLRFYVLHCLGFPLVAASLMALHFWRVRKDGGISGPL